MTVVGRCPLKPWSPGGDLGRDAGRLSGGCPARGVSRARGRRGAQGTQSPLGRLHGWTCWRMPRRGANSRDISHSHIKAAAYSPSSSGSFGQKVGLRLIYWNFSDIKSSVLFPVLNFCAKPPPGEGGVRAGRALTGPLLPYADVKTALSGHIRGNYDSGTDSRRCQALYSYKHYLCAISGAHAPAPQCTRAVMG